MQKKDSIIRILCSLRAAGFQNRNLQNACQVTRRAASFWAEAQVNDLPDSSIELEVARRHNASYPFIKNQVVAGTVVKVDRDHVTVDTGHPNKTAFAKKELHLSQLVKSREGSMRSGPRDFRIGDVIHFQLEELETPFGDVGLRVVKPADQDKARMIWGEIEAHRDSRTPLKGRILNPMNSGYSVGVGGVVGFLPFSLCSLLTASKVGLLQDFLVESADPVKRNLVLSEPQVAAEKAARRQEAKERAAMWESQRGADRSWFAEKPAPPPKPRVSREMMFSRVAMLAALVRDRLRQERARNPDDKRQIITPKSLLEAQTICRSKGAPLSKTELQTMLKKLKKEVSPKMFEEIVGRMRSWEVDTSLGDDDSGKQGSSSEAKES